MDKSVATFGGKKRKHFFLLWTTPLIIVYYFVVLQEFSHKDHLFVCALLGHINVKQGDPPLKIAITAAVFVVSLDHPMLYI